MKNNRNPRGQVSARRKDKALKVLDDLLDSPADHVRQKAAAALLASAAREEDAEAADPDAPRVYQIIPDNRRDPGVRYGLHNPEAKRVIIVPTWAGFPLEVQPEAHYAAVVKPPGVVAEREAAKARVEAARAKDPEAFRADCEAASRIPLEVEPCRDPSRPWLDLDERQDRRKVAALARLGLTPDATLAERVAKVQARNLAQGILPRPVVRLEDGSFQYLDTLPALPAPEAA